MKNILATAALAVSLLASNIGIASAQEHQFHGNWNQPHQNMRYIPGERFENHQYYNQNQYNRDFHLRINNNFQENYPRRYWNNNFTYYNNFYGYWGFYGGENVFITEYNGACGYWDGNQFIVFVDQDGNEYCANF